MLDWKLGRSKVVFRSLGNPNVAGSTVLMAVEKFTSSAAFSPATYPRISSSRTRRRVVPNLKVCAPRKYAKLSTTIQVLTTRELPK